MHAYNIILPLVGLRYLLPDPTSESQSALLNGMAGLYAGRPWVSVLVRSGVFQGGANSDKHAADYVVDDVLAAVRLAMGKATR